MKKIFFIATTLNFGDQEGNVRKIESLNPSVEIFCVKALGKEEMKPLAKQVPVGKKEKISSFNQPKHEDIRTLKNALPKEEKLLVNFSNTLLANTVYKEERVSAYA